MPDPDLGEACLAPTLAIIQPNNLLLFNIPSPSFLQKNTLKTAEKPYPAWGQLLNSQRVFLMIECDLLPVSYLSVAAFLSIS